MQVRILATQPMKAHIAYALALLREKGHSTIVLKAMGRAINKTVGIGELSRCSSKRGGRGAETASATSMRRSALRRMVPLHARS